MSEPARIDRERDDGSRVLTLWLVNRDRANALSQGMLTTIADTLDSIDDEVGVIVLRGAAGRFSSGVDLSQGTSSAKDGSVQGVLDRAIEAIRTCPVPVVALIERHCIGAAVEVAVNCDLRVAVRPARFEIPAIRIGRVYRSAGYEALLRRLSPTAVRRLLLLGERLSAEDALAAGLVDRLYDTAEEALETIAGHLLELPRETFHAQKLALDAALESRSLSAEQHRAISDLRRHGAAIPTGEDPRDQH
ncbi:enoyl-CoA hydratase/isomerase family protein [Actinomadura alba]|uniref:Enoyl-CoA hydratase/isomerase family protein n=1 Tax=Actinomadura alba TaxID=406431 RepID=A0ABR7LTA9_9ACTN|nr:enoyl-CoA hydratase/isomerase family protein [Actinomadura alba]MBC6468082.1 enoyl-CoA hydratase/isomerase family protein [Actinomadura alba]